MDPDYDYRKSHLSNNKAISYHKQFETNPYRAMIWRIEQSVLDEVFAASFPSVPVRHLDVACGSGRLLRHFADRCVESVGLDISRPMLQLARQHSPHSELLFGDITQGQILGDRVFDLITAFRFFPNAQDDLRLAAISAIASHLAPGGCLVFNNHKNQSSCIYRIGRTLRRGRQHSMSTGEVMSLLHGSGLDLARTYHIGIIPSTEKYRLLPTPVLEAAERRLSRYPTLRGWAFNHLFVCRANSGST